MFVIQGLAMSFEEGTLPLPAVIITMALVFVALAYLMVNFMNRVDALALVMKRGRLVLWVWFKECTAATQHYKSEPILIEDSPPPTRSASSPRSSPWVTPARRGGKTRFSAHRRRHTCSYSPTMANQCAYQAILKASGMPTTFPYVQDLRNRVAERLEDMYITNYSYLSINARDIIQQQHLTLRGYLAATRHDMWASILEVHAAALEQGISVYVKDGHQTLKVGQGPTKGLLYLHAAHWTLHRLHRGIVTKVAKASGQRGGMRAMVTLHSRPTPSPTAQVRPIFASPTTRRVERYSFRCDLASPDVAAITMLLPAGINVESALVVLSHILRIPASNLAISLPDEDDTLPPWTNAPFVAEVRRTRRLRAAMLYVHPTWSPTSFMIYVDEHDTTTTVLARIASIVNVPYQHLSFIQLLPGISDGDIANNIGIARGGMRNPPRSRSRSLSPTMPFVIEDDQEENGGDGSDNPYIYNGVPILQPSRPPPSPLPSDEDDGCDPTPPSDPYHTPERFRNRALQSPQSSQDAAETIDCSPESPPPAQHDLLDKPLHVHKTGETRYICAHPRANVERVLDHFMRKNRIIVDIDIYPFDARLWEDVDQLTLARAVRAQDRVFPALDVRRTAWEFHQDIREFPVELEGVTIAYAHASYETDIDTIFERLYNEIHGDMGYHLDLKYIKVEDAEAWTAICQGHHPLREDQEEEEEEHMEAQQDDQPTVTRNPPPFLPPLEILRGGYAFE